MAYIHDANAPTYNLRVPGMDRSIDIPASGVAQVRADEAEALIEHCPSITEHDPEDTD
jgi:hypothetical protein